MMFIHLIACLGIKYSPFDNALEDDYPDRYLEANFVTMWYFITTTMTTVGYGDYSAKGIDDMQALIPM